MVTLRIIRELAQGKESAMIALYDSFFISLCAYGCRFLQNEQVVKDIVQEVFMTVWNKRRDFTSVVNLRSFLYVSVRNACLNHLRDEKRKGQKVPLLEENLSNEEANLVIEEEVFRMISKEVEALPPKMREIFEMTLLDLKVKDIAEALKLSEYTVRNQKALAKKRLQERLKGKMFLLFL